MKLHLVTVRADARPQDAVRFILDTNVAAPFLRWMALDASLPEAAVVDAFAWFQSRHRTAMLASAFGRTRDMAVEMRWAAIETSRRFGEVDGERIARLDAAQALLGDWIGSVEPVRERIKAGPPQLRPRREVQKAFDGASVDIYHLEIMVCLVRLAKLHHRRKVGELTRPSDRLDALKTWTEDIQAVGGMSAFVFLAAVQTALAGDGAPARAMCKFSEYRDRETALKASSNASWDMLFLRMLQASELGLTPYTSFSGPTTLMTFDRQFAESAKGVVGAFLGADASDFRLPGSVAKLRQHLQKDVLDNPRMLARLDDVAREVQIRQIQRLSQPYKARYATMQTLLDEALEDLF